MCENASFQETELMDKTVRNHTLMKNWNKSTFTLDLILTINP